VFDSLNVVSQVLDLPPVGLLDAVAFVVDSTTLVVGERSIIHIPDQILINFFISFDLKKHILVISKIIPDTREPVRVIDDDVSSDHLSYVNQTV
jgi:hypothetical protein